MTRHDDQYSRLACFRALRDGRWLGTTHVADRTAMHQKGVHRALRRLRMEGLVDRNQHGYWRLNQAGLIVGLSEISTAEFLSRARAEHRACPRPPLPRVPNAVGPLTTEELLFLGAGGVRKMFGANLIVTEKSGEREHERVCPPADGGSSSESADREPADPGPAPAVGA